MAFQSVSLAHNVRPGAPLMEQTQTLFRCVAEQDFHTLAALCDDDFGIVDLDPSGGSVMVRDRKAWEHWFESLFAQLNAMQASTYTLIENYQVLESDAMAMSVVEFTQYLEVGTERHPFKCVVTIVWKKQHGQWREARWHCSLLERLAPESLAKEG